MNALFPYDKALAISIAHGGNVGPLVNPGALVIRCDDCDNPVSGTYLHHNGLNICRYCEELYIKEYFSNYRLKA